MLHYIITFFILAVIAGFLGFSGLAAGFAEVARILTGVFVVLFLAGLIYSLLTGRNPKPPV